MIESEPMEGNKAIPRTATLMLANALAWCVYFCFLLIFFFDWFYPHWKLIMLFAGIVLITTIGQVIINIVVRRKKLTPWKRVLIFSLPSSPIALIAFALALFLLWTTLSNIRPVTPEQQRSWDEAMRIKDAERRIKVILSNELQQEGVTTRPYLQFESVNFRKFSFLVEAKNGCDHYLIARALKSDGSELGRCNTRVGIGRDSWVRVHFKFAQNIDIDVVDKFEISIAQ